MPRHPAPAPDDRARRLPRAVLWDMDGTLVDTEPLWNAVQRRLVVEHGGTWCPPTVLVDVTDEMAVVREESFATVLPVMVVADEEEAIACANATEFGLSAAVFSGDRERAERVARRLHAGGISINDAALTGLVQTAEKQSFKCSGMGGSRMGSASIRRFVRARALLVNTGTDSPWWFPPAA